MCAVNATGSGGQITLKQETDEKRVDRMTFDCKRTKKEQQKVNKMRLQVSNVTLSVSVIDHLTGVSLSPFHLFSLLAI
jgi:hypothetical protein